MGNYHPEDTSGSGAGVEPLVRLWLLRLLVGAEAFEKSFRNKTHRYSEEELICSLAEVFDIDMEACRTEDDDIDCKEALRRLHRLYLTTENTLKDATAPECLAGERRTPVGAGRAVCNGLPHPGICRSHPH